MLADLTLDKTTATIHHPLLTKWSHCLLQANKEEMTQAIVSCCQEASSGLASSSPSHQILVIGGITKSRSSSSVFLLSENPMEWSAPDRDSHVKDVRLLDDQQAFLILSRSSHHFRYVSP